MSDVFDEDFLINIPNSLSTEEEINKILKFASDKDVSDIFIRSDDHIWASIYGKKKPLTKRKLSNNEVKVILNQIYGSHSFGYLSEGQVINKSHDFFVNDGVDEYKRPIRKRYRFRLNATSFLSYGTLGVVLTFRSIPTTVPELEKMDVEQAIIDCSTKTDQGLIVVCGATGNGKSTLLAGLIGYMLRDPNGHRNIITIESPIEFVYDTIDKPTSIITQCEVGQSLQSFHQGVENALRQAPNTILVGEARDYETISSAINASVTGHTCFSTVHSNNTHETIPRMIAQYPEELRDQAKNSLNDALKMIVVQRLIPSVDNKRVAIRSYLEFDDEVREIIANTKKELISKKIKELTIERGQSMTKSATNHYKDGKISKEWLDRVKINYGE